MEYSTIIIVFGLIGGLWAFLMYFEITALLKYNKDQYNKQLLDILAKEREYKIQLDRKTERDNLIKYSKVQIDVIKKLKERTNRMKELVRKMRKDKIYRDDVEL